MRRVFLAVFILVAFMGCRVPTNIQNNYFGLINDGIYFIVDNTIKFHSLDDDGWSETYDFEFTLPSGYKSVFPIANEAIGVVLDNTVKIYVLDYYGDSNGWVELYSIELALPSGYKNVFCGYHNGDYFFDVIVGNTVQIYPFLGDDGNERKDMNFNLPGGYKSVFSYIDNIGVFVGDTVKFYQYENGWKEVKNMEFTPPSGYKNVYGIFFYICVEAGNSIKFYSYDNRSNNWNELPDLEFILR